MNKKVGKILTAAAAGAAVGVAVKKLQDSRKEKEDERIAAIEEAVMNNRDYGDRKAYLVGGGHPGCRRVSDPGLQVPCQPDNGLRGHAHTWGKQ